MPEEPFQVVGRGTFCGFGERPEAAAGEPSGGWGRSQDRERNQMIEQAGINTTIAHLEAQGWTLSADRQRDGVGYDLEFTGPGGLKKVEVKGISGADVAFNLTAKEYEMSRTDGEWLLVAVTDALGNPKVHEIAPAALHKMAIDATQYRVRTR